MTNGTIINGIVYIVAGQRTPLGRLAGGLAPLSAPELGAVAIKATLARANIGPEDVDVCYMGNVLQANAGKLGI